MRPTELYRLTVFRAAPRLSQAFRLVCTKVKPCHEAGVWPGAAHLFAGCRVSDGVWCRSFEPLLPKPPICSRHSEEPCSRLLYLTFLSSINALQQQPVCLFTSSLTQRFVELCEKTSTSPYSLPLELPGKPPVDLLSAASLRPAAAAAPPSVAANTPNSPDLTHVFSGSNLAAQQDY